MWVARVLKRPVDKDNATSSCRAKFIKLDTETFFSVSRWHTTCGLVTTILQAVLRRDRSPSDDSLENFLPLPSLLLQRFLRLPNLMK